jgi:hypothetical protein
MAFGKSINNELDILYGFSHSIVLICSKGKNISAEIKKWMPGTSSLPAKVGPIPNYQSTCALLQRQDFIFVYK